MSPPPAVQEKAMEKMREFAAANPNTGDEAAVKEILRILSQFGFGTTYSAKDELEWFVREKLPEIRKSVSGRHNKPAEKSAEPQERKLIPLQENAVRRLVLKTMKKNPRMETFTELRQALRPELEKVGEVADLAEGFARVVFNAERAVAALHKRLGRLTKIEYGTLRSVVYDKVKKSPGFNYITLESFITKERPFRNLAAQVRQRQGNNVVRIRERPHSQGEPPAAGPKQRAARKR